MARSWYPGSPSRIRSRRYAKSQIVARTDLLAGHGARVASIGKPVCAARSLATPLPAWQRERRLAGRRPPAGSYPAGGCEVAVDAGDARARHNPTGPQCSRAARSSAARGDRRTRRHAQRPACWIGPYRPLDARQPTHGGHRRRATTRAMSAGYDGDQPPGGKWAPRAARTWHRGGALPRAPCRAKERATMGPHVDATAGDMQGAEERQRPGTRTGHSRGGAGLLAEAGSHTRRRCRSRGGVVNLDSRLDLVATDGTATHASPCAALARIGGPVLPDRLRSRPTPPAARR